MGAHIVFSFTAVLLLFQSALHAAARSEAPVHRYLFMIETSANMARNRQALRETVYDLLQSGGQGAIKRGDLVQIWCFNESLQKDVLPPVTWDPQESTMVAGKTDQFLAAVPMENKSNLRASLAGVYRELKGPVPATIVLFSEGKEPIDGTPFDFHINGLFRHHLLRLRAARRPFVTVLLQDKGKFVNYAVHEGGLSLPLMRVGGFELVREPEPEEEKKRGFASRFWKGVVRTATFGIADGEPKREEQTLAQTGDRPASPAPPVAERDDAPATPAQIALNTDPAKPRSVSGVLGSLQSSNQVSPQPAPEVPEASRPMAPGEDPKPSAPAAARPEEPATPPVQTIVENTVKEPNPEPPPRAVIEPPPPGEPAAIEKPEPAVPVADSTSGVQPPDQTVSAPPPASSTIEPAVTESRKETRAETPPVSEVASDLTTDRVPARIGDVKSEITVATSARPEPSEKPLDEPEAEELSEETAIVSTNRPVPPGPALIDVDSSPASLAARLAIMLLVALAIVSGLFFLRRRPGAPGSIISHALYRGDK